MRNTINFGITLPKEVFVKTELLRGYYSRSKFIMIALESLAETMENKMPLSLQVDRPKETEAIRSLNESIQTQEPVIDHE